MDHECKKEEIIDEIKDRLNSGDIVINDLKRSVEEGNGLIKKMHDRMFIDANSSSPCVQTMLDRHQNILKAFMWVICTLSGAVIVISAKIIITAIIGEG